MWVIKLVVTITSGINLQMIETVKHLLSLLDGGKNGRGEGITRKHEQWVGVLLFKGFNFMPEIEDTTFAIPFLNVVHIIKMQNGQNWLLGHFLLLEIYKLWK
jgi:hypothetical protein